MYLRKEFEKDMNIQQISAGQNSRSLAFKASYVTLSQKNLGEKIATNVVEKFNKNILPEIRKTQVLEADTVIKNAGIGSVIEKAKDFQDKVNFFTLAAGSGSRFRELAQTVGDYNKISLPFKVDKDTDIHMLDFAMAMGKYFIGEEGIKTIVASKPSGSFGDIVAHYLQGNPIKDTIVCCGDNVFGDKASEMVEFFTRMLNNPKKHVALVGVGRTPAEVANRFGVLECESGVSDQILKLKGFSEKPPIEEAEKLAINGENIANTGLFYLSKEAMTNLMEEIKNGINNIKKNDSEPYDFANAVKYVHSMLPKWFGIASKEGADVKVVKKWEDVGEPQALYSFANEVKQGTFLANFPKILAEKIQDSFGKRVHLDNENPHIIFSESTNVTSDAVKNSKQIDGVHIVV